MAIETSRGLLVWPACLPPADRIPASGWPTRANRSAAAIDAGGVLPAFTGVLVRDGYAGYAHLPAVHAWCAARPR